jgi:hypothetical protein
MNKYEIWMLITDLNSWVEWWNWFFFWENCMKIWVKKQVNILSKIFFQTFSFVIKSFKYLIKSEKKFIKTKELVWNTLGPWEWRVQFALSKSRMSTHACGRFSTKAIKKHCRSWGREFCNQWRRDLN